MHITIIAAGYTGAALAMGLATSFDTDLGILLAGVASNFGCGIAYGEARGEHLLNAALIGNARKPHRCGFLALRQRRPSAIDHSLRYTCAPCARNSAAFSAMPASSAAVSSATPCSAA